MNFHGMIFFFIDVFLHMVYHFLKYIFPFFLTELFCVHACVLHMSSIHIYVCIDYII